MDLDSLTAISPVDGRYRNKTAPLANFFSEYALIRYRLFVEIEYFIALCEIPLPQLRSFGKNNFSKLRRIFTGFDTTGAKRIKEIEKITNHDVKAVEYFLKKEFENAGWAKYGEFIHFALTSQDISNTAIPLSLKDAVKEIYLPLLDQILLLLKTRSEEWKSVPMLAHTHGQPASPTRLGKELRVFTERLEVQLNQLLKIPYSAKFGGATGNFNAHCVAYPQIDWVQFGNHLVNDILRLSRSQTTTQIEHYDNLASFCDALKRINTILIDLCRDLWTYISMEYFRQKIKPGEVGSSTMPHKVNPIDFENAEGNLGVANALFEHLSAKLPVSRLQRDLTDSTVLRNIGVPVAHSVIAFESLLKGLNKLQLNETKISTDLEDNWSVVSEAIQTVLRREGYPKPYEALKELTRVNSKIDKTIIHNFIDKLDVSDDVRTELKKITPQNYTGLTL